jgi:hypothetical protein
MTTSNREREHEDVYGKSFALYDSEQMKQFTGFFEQRLLASRDNPYSQDRWKILDLCLWVQWVILVSYQPLSLVVQAA